MSYKLYEVIGACFTKDSKVFEIVKRDYCNSIEDLIWDVEVELKRKYGSKFILAYTSTETVRVSSRASEMKLIDLGEFKHKYNMVVELYDNYKKEVEDVKNKNNTVRLNYLKSEYERYTREYRICTAIMSCYKELGLW